MIAHIVVLLFACTTFALPLHNETVGSVCQHVVHECYLVLQSSMLNPSARRALVQTPHLTTKRCDILTIIIVIANHLLIDHMVPL